MTGIRNFVAALTLSTLGTILFHLIFNQKFNLFYYYLAPSTSKLVSNETELIELSLKHQNYELTYNGNQKNLSCSDINSKTISTKCANVSVQKFYVETRHEKLHTRKQPHIHFSVWEWKGAACSTTRIFEERKMK